jgi:predicted RNA methylase
MLAEQGASALLEKKPRPKQLPLCNYRAPEGIACLNPYGRGEVVTYAQVEMTRAEFAKLHPDHKSTAVCEYSHRVRIAFGYRIPGVAADRGRLVCVYITDSKAHAKPEPGKPPEPKAPRLLYEDAPHPAPVRDEKAEAFKRLEQQARAGVEVVTSSTLYPTPPDVCARMVEEAELDAYMRVLEPSAGTGNILRAIGPGPDKVAVEISAGLAQVLTRCGSGLKIVQGDFLECGDELGTFDRVLMNPPFNGGADIAHVRHALRFLKPGGRLVGICAAGPRQESNLRPMAEASGGLWEALPPDTFKEAGTAVRAVLFSINA